MNRDRAVATLDLGVKIEAVLVEAIPEFKQVKLYSLEGKSIKRDEHFKQEKIAEVWVVKGQISEGSAVTRLGRLAVFWYFSWLKKYKRLNF